MREVAWHHRRADANNAVVRLGSTNHIVEVRVEGYAVMELDATEQVANQAAELDHQADAMESQADDYAARIESYRENRRPPHQAVLTRMRHQVADMRLRSYAMRNGAQAQAAE